METSLSSLHRDGLWEEERGPLGEDDGVGDNMVVAATGILGEVAPRIRKTPGPGTILGSWSRAVTLHWAPSWCPEIRSLALVLSPRCWVTLV